MQNFGYRSLASYYDRIYDRKNYFKESRFIRDFLNMHGAKSVLDVGCGTGNHILRLKRYGFDCFGADLNYEMLAVAKSKVRVPLVQADMRALSFGRSFSAVICMYATFNHNIEYDDARKTARCFRNCLGSDGVVLIDLHNPSNSGRRIDVTGDAERDVAWELDRESRIERSRVRFKIGDQIIEDRHTMRIYSMEEMRSILEDEGFELIGVYEGYGFVPATDNSKNLEIVGRVKL